MLRRDYGVQAQRPAAGGEEPLPAELARARDLKLLRREFACDRQREAGGGEQADAGSQPLVGAVLDQRRKGVVAA
ncbi:MAG: hypothetical protein ACRDL5_00630, partial [Solirubrobacteraceae bacterium]